MKFKKIFLSILVSILFINFNVNFPFNSIVKAASYSQTEAKKIKHFQAQYHKLNTNIYDSTSLYEIKPNFSFPFNSGVLKKEYIQTSIDFINYYRSLFNLPVEINPEKDNTNAQLGAAALASVNANTSLSAHGLLGYRRPNYFSKNDWMIAENSTLGNINFLESSNGSSAGEIVTDLLQDINNISGNCNTGHRALILSARATHIGIGAAYGKNNGKLYSVENGIFADDILRPVSINTVTYPSKGVFPYELLSAGTPWSVYFAKQHISRTPKIYTTDLTTGKKYLATQVYNFGSDYFSSGYNSTITFMPNSKMKIVNTHKYRVQIGKIYNFSFKLFRQKGTLFNKNINK